MTSPAVRSVILELLDVHLQELNTRWCEYADRMRTLGPDKIPAVAAWEALEVEVEQFVALSRQIKALP